MNYSTSVRIKNNWTVLHYFDIKIDPETEITYLSSSHRNLGLEFSIKEFPPNGIIFDFFQAKQILKKFISKMNRKVILCTNSRLYSLKITDESVLVQVNSGDCYMFKDKNCLIFECDEEGDKLISQKLAEYVLRKIVNFEVESVVYGNVFICDEESRVLSESFFEFGRDL